MASTQDTRFSTFNLSLNRDSEGQLIEDLSTPDNGQAQTVAEIIQRNNPDILLLNEFDFDPEGRAAALFQENYLSVSQNGADPVEYPFRFVAPSNTGIASGFDLNNDGVVDDTPGDRSYGDDALGFGEFPGQFAMAFYSKYPIVEADVRTFQNFIWQDMPGALLPDDPETPAPQDYYSPEELEEFRLSSKSHWDIPIEVNGEIVHVLASHPTPPVFDGPEDRNGRRNFDEIRFWADYVTPGKGDYIYDDAGNFGGLAAGSNFVIMGDQNADPFDGDSVPGAIQQLLDNPRVNTSTAPLSEGGVEQALLQDDVNLTHTANPSFDTADFAEPPGNLRVDYVLPSENLEIEEASVFWPTTEDPLFPLVGIFDPNSPNPNGFPSSDHRLVRVDATVEPTPPDVNRRTVTDVELLGEVTFDTGRQFEGTEVGGLSGITYDPANKVYYSISDDRSEIDPARFYTLAIDLNDGKLQNGDVRFQDVTTLLAETDEPFPEQSLDPEGIALTNRGTLFISSEGDASQLINPFVNQFSLQGEQFQALPVPEKFLPVAEGTSGIRNNLAFESLTVSPDNRFLYTATENALNQDGPAADVEQESLSRIIKYDLSTGEPVQEFVYAVEPVPEAPNPAEGFRTNGLVDLLAIDNNGTLLSLERSFSEGVGNTVKLFEVRTQGVLDVSGEDSLFSQEAGAPFEIDSPVAKRELVDFADLGVTPDNLEGLSFGPQLPDGRQSLIVVSDNNFSEAQTTQFIGLALDLETIPAALPTVETPPVVDRDEAPADTIPGDADDPAIYVHPTNASKSLVISSLKDGGLATYNLKGELVQRILPANFGDIRYNNVDLVYGFELGGQSVDLAVASDRENDTLAIFQIDPDTRQLTDVTADSIPGSIFRVDDGEQTAYGLATYTSPVSGKSYVFVSQREGNQVAQLELVANAGQVDARLVRTLTLPTPEGGELAEAQIEGMVADRELGFLYVGQEAGGIYKFSAEPNGGDTGELIDEVRPNGSNLEADVEGLTIYYGEDGSGYLLASSQGDSTFAAYERAGTNEYLGSFVVSESGGIDAVEESDGADVINVPLGSQFPSGLLVVQDGANQPQVVAQDEEELENISTNFKFVPWENVTAALPDQLAIETSNFDPRNPGLFGEGSRKTFLIPQGDGTKVITNFGGVGNGTNPSPSTIAEVDTLQFEGEGLSAENLLLNQVGSDLVITFEGIQDTEVRLRDFALENLDNLQQATGASADIGNITFDGQSEVEDSFDVFDAEQQRQQVFQRDNVTFLNGLDNDIQGFDGSDDVINAQGGNDTLAGLGGDDVLRGGNGDDTLTGGAGEDQFWIASGGLPEGTETITDFEVGTDVLGIAGLPGVTGFGDLNISQTGADTVIAALNQDLAILRGIESSTINSSSFAFA